MVHDVVGPYTFA